MNHVTQSLPLALLALALPVSAGDETQSYQEAPLVLGRDTPRLNELIPDLALETVGGEETSLSKVAGERGLVIAMRDPECPLSKKYSPRLRELEATLAERKFGLLYVGVLTPEMAQKDVDDFKLTAPYAIDTDGELAGHLAATTTTEVFVLDAARTLIYRGMIDDQYGLGFSKNAAKNNYLEDALTAVTNRTALSFPATQAQGCLLDVEPIEVERPVTYHNRVSRIIQNRCQECHRPGAPGPFKLMDYADAKKRKGMYEWVIEEDVMPPRFAEHGSGPWRNNLSLTESEREDFLAWIANGAPEGDPADSAVERNWIDGWSIGEPDLAVTVPTPFTVPAEGVVDYQYLFAKTNLTEDRWVKSVQILPGAPEVVHHVLVFLAEPEVYDIVQRGERIPRSVFVNGAATYFASAVPGQGGLTFPDGYAKKLPAGATLTFQMHYTPVGREMVDQTRIGFVFTDEPVLAEVRTNSAYDDSFSIPPRAFDYKVTGDFYFKEAGSILSLLPHTHLRGSRFLCELVYPTGEQETILHLPLYDFNWQMNYELATPVDVPAGTRLRATAWYDNTEDNPANPDPDRWVSFGEQTFDEMMISYVNWVPAKPDAVEASFKKAGDSKGQ